MKNYELVNLDGCQMLKSKAGETTRWIPLDPANSDYAEHLRYTAWVEAGNNPDDFWSQSEDFLDTSVSEVSEPKKETPQKIEGES